MLILQPAQPTFGSQFTAGGFFCWSVGRRRPSRCGPPVAASVLVGCFDGGPGGAALRTDGAVALEARRLEPPPAGPSPGRPGPGPQLDRSGRRSRRRVPKVLQRNIRTSRQDVALCFFNNDFGWESSWSRTALGRFSDGTSWKLLEKPPKWIGIKKNGALFNNRIDKVTVSTNATVKVVITGSWILQVSPFLLNFTQR